MCCVDILMPTYNNDEFIGHALKSLLEQTHKEIRIFIIDDGSTDRTKEKVSAFTGSKVVYLTKKHGGIVSALNYGLKYVEADLVMRHDSDDLTERTKVEKQVGFLEENPHISAVGTWMKSVTVDGEIMSTGIRRDATDWKEVRNAYGEEVHGMVNASVMFRRDILQEFPTYSDKYLYAEDYDYWSRVTEHYRCSNIPEFLYFYRQHESQTYFKHRSTQKANFHRAIRACRRRRKLT